MLTGVVTNATEWRSHKLQGRCKFQALPISIENERGSYRQGEDPDGHMWRTFMHMPYGYVRLTEGTDGDHVDVYIGPNQTSTKVFIIHQQVPETKAYDEDKVMLGYNSAAEAKHAYVRQYDKPGFFQSMEEHDMATFKKMLKERRGMKLKKSMGTKAQLGEVTTHRDGTKWKKLAPGKWVQLKGDQLQTAKKMDVEKKVASMAAEPAIFTHRGKSWRERNLKALTAWMNGGCGDIRQGYFEEKQTFLGGNKEGADAMAEVMMRLPGLKTLYRGTHNKEWANADAGTRVPLGIASFSKSVRQAKVFAKKYKKGKETGYGYVIRLEPSTTRAPRGLDTEKVLAHRAVGLGILRDNYAKEREVILNEEELEVVGKTDPADDPKGVTYIDVRIVSKSMKKSKDALVESLSDDLGTPLNRDKMEKAKRMPIGTVSHGRKKVAEGKWVPVKNLRQPKKDAVTGSSKFKKWFKGSKVTDKTGNPLVVYHGTPKTFESFSSAEAGSSSGNTGFFGNGLYFSAEEDRARSYATGKEGVVMPVYLSIQNPFIISATITAEQAEILSEATYGDFEEGQSAQDVYSAVSYAAAEMEDFGEVFRESVEQYGYDGVIFNEGQELVAFYPSQIKTVEELKDVQKSLDKSKRMPIGTISRGRKKVAERKWVPVKQSKEGKPSKGEELATFASKEDAIKPVVDYKSVPLAEFVPIRDAKTPKEFASFVTPYSPEEYAQKNAKVYVSATGKSGYAITEDGDLISVFSEPGAHEGSSIMLSAIINGATTLDCLGPVLPTIYEKYGFEVVETVPWDDQYAPPDWNYEDHGTPSVYYMKLGAGTMQKSKYSEDITNEFENLSLRYITHMFGSSLGDLEKTKYLDRELVAGGKWKYTYDRPKKKKKTTTYKLLEEARVVQASLRRVLRGPDSPENRQKITKLSVRFWSLEKQLKVRGIKVPKIPEPPVEPDRGYPEIELYLGPDIIKSKYIRKYFKNGRWNYIYPENGGTRRPRAMPQHKELQNLGGTTGGAMLVRMPNGEEKVVKHSTGTGHLKEEYMANRIYKILGVPVPNVALYNTDKGPAQVADKIEGVPLGDLDPEQRSEATQSLKRGFIADALLGNWDVLGMDEDNILWDGSKAWRIDNGGSMRYRAQGAPKGDKFGGEVIEVNTMRDPYMGAGQVFEGIGTSDIQDQVNNVLAHKEPILHAVEDPSLRKIIETRINWLGDTYGVKKSIEFPETALIKSNDGRWYLKEHGMMTRFYWFHGLDKAIKIKSYYSPEEVKARGLRWVTIRNSRVLLQGTSDGGYVVVGGAGGKLNHLKVDRILSQEQYKSKRKDIEKRGKEETRALTKEELAEHREKRKAQVAARREAKTEYTKQVSEILGVTPEEIKSEITNEQMAEIEKKARKMVEARATAKTMDEDALEDAIDVQTEAEIKKAVDKQVKSVERAALQTLVDDYSPSDPNEQPSLAKLLDKDKALEVLSARKQFKNMVKEIGKEGADIPTNLKIGAITAADGPGVLAEVQKEIADTIETQKNMRLYDMMNAQSISIQKHVDQGAASSLNGLIGDIYGAGATFSQDTIEKLGIEAVSRAITIKLQSDGKGEVVRQALEEYVANEREKVVTNAVAQAEKRFKNANELRNLARDSGDAEAILSLASANGYALKQITGAQRALGTAVGSLRAAAHMLNALNDPPADVVQVDMGKDLARAREQAKAAGLQKGTYSIRTQKKGRAKRLVMEIPKESLNNFFQNNIEKTDSLDRVDLIKQHKMNDGYIPPGMKEGIKLDPAQEAGLRLFNEKERVLLDFEAGLGKTAVAYAAIADAMANKGAKKILVVTPSATRGDFHKQRETFLEKDLQKQVRQSTANTSKTERRKRHLEGEGVHIISQDALREDASILKDSGYDMVIVDEIHEMTAGTGQAGRFKALKELDGVPLKIAMSGTNIKSDKKEMYRKIDFIDPEHDLGTMKEFGSRYKGLNQGTGIFADAANDAFRKEIGQWSYTQKNQLPVENKANMIRIPMTADQRKEYAASERKYREDRENKVPGASGQRDSRNYAILSDAGATSNGKLDRMVDIMKSDHPDEKAVIHVSQPGKPVLKAMESARARLATEFGDNSVAVIHGETGPGELAKIKERFNAPGDPLRFIVGTKSLESGHNLQGGGTVTFHLDIPDSQASLNQRTARVFRKGQDKDTTSYILSGLNPMDMRSEDMLETKKKEMGILGNPREIEAMDDTGFIGMLNKYEEGISA